MKYSRKQSVSDIYHVVHRGNGRQIIYESDKDRSFFCNLLSKYQEEFSVDVCAWCLMDNHFHLLLHADLDNIANLMKNLCANYARYFNRVHDRVGNLFQGRYKSQPIDDDAYLKCVVRYIHQNPPKSGLGNMEKWPWSSYQNYLQSENISHFPIACKTKFVKEIFENKKNFVDLHSEFVTDSSLLDAFDFTAANFLESELAEVASTTLDSQSIYLLKTYSVENRNDLLKKLHDAGLSIRQIERMTGIGRSIISRAISGV